MPPQDPIVTLSSSEFKAFSSPSALNTQYIVLNDDNRIPVMGLGTWGAQGQEVKNAVKAAIYYGYRHIDTATNYKNEELVGEAIEECIQENVIKREELFITTKLWNNSHSDSAVPKAIKASLRALKLDYLDLYLIHWPTGYKEGTVLSPTNDKGQIIESDIDYIETWRAMEECRYNGLTRSIGVSNFNHEQMERIISNCHIVPAINQIECHPYLSQNKLIRYCHSKSVHVTAYSPLGSPGNRNATKNEPILLEDPIVKSIAKAHGRSPAQVLLRYQIQRQVTVIPKAVTLKHIKSNLEAFEFELTKEDMVKLDGLDRNLRFLKFERCYTHPHYPFNVC